MALRTESPCSPSPSGPMPSNPSYARRVLIAAGIIFSIILLLIATWFTIRVIVLIFIGVLIAVFLREISNRVALWSHLPARIGLTLTILFFAALAGTAAWMLLPRIHVQVNRLIDELPQAVHRVETFVENDIGLPAAEKPRETLGGMDGIVAKVGDIFSFTFGALADTVIVFFVSLYLAFTPDFYINGIIRLVPIGLRREASALIETLGDTLKWWLLGISMMMVVVGILSGMGLWLLNIPLALTLGILAGLLTFIPYFGPIVSSIPAILMGLLVDVRHAVYVVLLYLLIHILEGYILSPLVQERTVYLPPIVTLSAIAAMSVLLGIPGLIVATPATAVMLVLVKRIYIQGILGDDDAT